jgi:hypothetical protein
MTFNETILSLYEATNSIVVYAAQAYNFINGENVPAIGVRSFFAGYDNNDPIIDGVPFMVCGKITNDKHREMKDIHDLLETKAVNCRVLLRAVTGYPSVTVDLGEFCVGCKSSIDKNGTIIMHLDRMH